MLKGYKLLITLIALTLILSSVSEAAKRRVVIEDHTGAWCGWCPLGSQELKDYKDVYGDYVIPLQLHNQDRMTIPQEAEVKGAVGVSSYPGGTLNRELVAGSRSHHPTAWDANMQSMLAEETPISVEVEWSISGSMLNATVTATADAMYDQQLALNLIVVEDGMTGTGTGWDQVNFLSNRQGYEDHPYYSKGGNITGYIHDNVIQLYAGGSFGDASGMPSSMAAGESVSKEFSVDLSTLNVQNTDNVWVVGLAQTGAIGEIVNAISDGKDLPSKTPIRVELDMVSDQYILNEAGTEEVVEFNINNISDFPVTVSIDTESSVLSNQNWSANFSGGDIQLVGGGSENATVTVSDAAGQAGIAIINASAQSDVSGDSFFVSPSTTAYVLNDNTRNMFFYGFSNNANLGLFAMQTTTDFLQDFAPIPASLDLMNAYDFDFVETAIFDFSTNGTVALLTTDDLPAKISSMIDNGTDILLASESVMTYSDAITEITPTANANALLKSTLGLSLSGVQTLVNNNQVSNLPVTPNTDYISVGLTINSGYNQTRIYNYYVDAYNLGADQTALTWLGTTPADNAVGCVGIEVGDSRIAVSGYSIEATYNTSGYQTHWKEVYDWIKGSGEPKLPVMEVASTLDFGSVSGEDRVIESLEITNSGNAALVITRLTIVDDASGKFSTTGNSEITVGVGRTQNVPVFFQPDGTPGDYSAKLRIITEDNPNGVDVSLTANEIVSSVFENEIPGLITLNPMPNTFESISNLSVNVNGNEDVRINMINSNGIVVENLHSGIISGTKNIELDASNLTSGKYFILANIDGKVVKTPVVVNK